MIKAIFHKILHFLYSRKFLLAFGILFLVISIAEFIFFSHYQNKESESFYFSDSSKLFSIHIPRNLNFADEKVPIDDFSTLESMERELLLNTYSKSQPLFLHKRANRWFPVIEPILRKNKIPDDFKYIAIIESQLTNAVSPRGATGFWQLIEGTAKHYGLEISEDVDERYSVTKSTEAACKYFKEAYKQFNNWTLAAASYNLGISGIQRELAEQNRNEYYNLLLTRETARYIFKLLAMKEIISRPHVYGFQIREKNLLPSQTTKKITVDSTIHNLTLFANGQGSNIRIIKALNPWLRSNKLDNPGKKKYIIEVVKNNLPVYDYEGNYISIEKNDSSAVLKEKSDSALLHKNNNTVH